MGAWQRFGRAAVWVLVASSAPACLAGPGQTDASGPPGDGASCELALQGSSFAGTCGELTLHNNGAEAMQGWTIGFELPPGGHLVSGWNAVFAVDGSHVTLTPTAAENDLAADATLTIGYCATGQASHLSLNAGHCGAPADTSAAPAAAAAGATAAAPVSSPS